MTEEIKIKEVKKGKVEKDYDFLKPYRFKKGQSGNPSGRPKGAVSLVTSLREYLNKHPEEKRDLIKALIKQGKLGNVVATKEILDRVDGKVKEVHEIEGELPIKLIFVPAKVIGSSAEFIEGEATEIRNTHLISEGK